MKQNRIQTYIYIYLYIYIYKGAKAEVKIISMNSTWLNEYLFGKVNICPHLPSYPQN